MTSCAIARKFLGVAGGCLLALAVAGCGGGAAATRRTLADLTNPFLGPERSSWLVGAVSRLATPEEIAAYLALRDDSQAEAFIQRFWDRRDPAPDRPGNPLREAFEQRAAEADRLYSEAGYRGQRTDRGTIFVLYGPPDRVDFEISPSPADPAIEVWIYGDGSPSGLDARRPLSRYRFIKRGDLTVSYGPDDSNPHLRQLPPAEPQRF